MDIKERIAICKTCQNSKFDMKTGIICGITNEKAKFDNICRDFIPKEGEKNPFIKEQELNIQYSIGTSGYTTTNSSVNGYYFEGSTNKPKEAPKKKVKVKLDMIWLIGISALNIIAIRIVSFLFASQLMGSIVGILLCAIVLPVFLVRVNFRTKLRPYEIQQSEFLSMFLVLAFGSVFLSLYVAIFLWWSYYAWIEIFMYAFSIVIIGIPTLLISKKIATKIQQ